jgi:hypothetical protein
MLKVIKTNREKKGGGRITRFALGLPWFSVWVDLCEAELIGYSDPQYLGEMLHSELSDASHCAFGDVVDQSISSGAFESHGC